MTFGEVYQEYCEFGRSGKAYTTIKKQDSLWKNHLKEKLQYASKELRNDRDVVLAAVKKDWSALQWASKELRSDESFIKENIKNNSYLL